MDQLLIAVTTVPAIFLSQTRSARLQRLACMFGIAGAPVWLWTSFNPDSWGVFVTAIASAMGWLYGLWNFWGRRG